MAHEEQSIDWDHVMVAGRKGGLLKLLVMLPRDRWAERNETGATLLHYACSGPNVAAVVALLQSGLVDVNAPNEWDATPAHYAASFAQPRALEVLCVAGAHLQPRNHDGCSPIDVALELFGSDNKRACVRILVANGVRLSTVREDYRRLITPELGAFERGVLCCRAAVVAMLRVKRAGQLWMWDKFLLLEMALCIWSTRYDKGWQTAAHQQEPAHAMLPPQ